MEVKYFLIFSRQIWWHDSHHNSGQDSRLSVLSLWNNHAGPSYTDYTRRKLRNQGILSVNNNKNNNNSNSTSKENKLVPSQGYVEHAFYTDYTAWELGNQGRVVQNTIANTELARIVISVL